MLKIVIFPHLIREDIEEVLKKHKVPEEFYALQLSRILTEMLGQKCRIMPDET